VRSATGRLLRFNFPTEEEKAAAARFTSEKSPPAKRKRQDEQQQRPAGPKSSLHGVTWHKKKGKWQARMLQKPVDDSSRPASSTTGASAQGKSVHKHLGYFEDEDSAGRAFDAAAREAHGELAHGRTSGEGKGCRQMFLNFPTPGEEARVVASGGERGRRRQGRRSRPAAANAAAAGVGSSWAGAEGGEEVELQAPAAQIPSSAFTAGAGAGAASGGGSGGAGVPLFSPQSLEGGLDMLQQQQLQQLERQQLYLLRTALMVGGQELYAQVGPPPDGDDDAPLPVVDDPDDEEEEDEEDDEEEDAGDGDDGNSQQEDLGWRL
jgi:hypothetical protein